MEGEVCLKEFYTDAAKYWENIPATVDGMLGGFGFISDTDIDGSDEFLKALFTVWHAFIPEFLVSIIEFQMSFLTFILFIGFIFKQWFSIRFY